VVVGLVVWLRRLGRADEELVAYPSRQVSYATPLVHVRRRGIEFEVALGDGAEFRRVGDAVARLTPTPVVVGVTVEVALDPVGGVAPDGSGRGAGGDLTEELDVPGRWSLEYGEHALGPGPFEGGVDQGEIAHELGAPGCAGVECLATLMVMGVELRQSGASVGLSLSGSVEPVVGLVEVVGGGADRVGVSTWPTLSRQAVVV
jgi:hypothetical protein